MSRRRQPVAILPVLAEDGTQRFSGDGTPLFTRMWGEGASLADAGWQLAKETHMTHVEQVEALAKARNIGFDEALATDEGKAAYNEYIAEQREGANAPGSPKHHQSDDTLNRSFAGDAATLRGVEAEVAAKVDDLLEKEGKHTPSTEDKAEAMSRVLGSEPDLYSRYVAEQRRAIGR